MVAERRAELAGDVPGGGVRDRTAAAYEQSNLWVFYYPRDRNWLTKIGEVFFGSGEKPGPGDSVPKRISKARERAGIYRRFTLVCAVIMAIPGWRLVFINNLPSNYRIVPRVFWDDGIERLQIAQFLLELHMKE